MLKLDRVIPWQLRHPRIWLDMRRCYRELRQARRHGRAVLAVSAGIVLK